MEDIFFCEVSECSAIFLTKEDFTNHVAKDHCAASENEKTDRDRDKPKKKPKMGPASQVKRKRSPSSSPERKKQPNESIADSHTSSGIKKKKIGPASRVKRSPSPTAKDRKVNGEESRSDKKSEGISTNDKEAKVEDEKAIVGRESVDKPRFKEVPMFSTDEVIKKKVKIGPASKVRKESSPDKKTKEIESPVSQNGSNDVDLSSANDVKEDDKKEKTHTKADSFASSGVKKKVKIGPASVMRKERTPEKQTMDTESPVRQNGLKDIGLKDIGFSSSDDEKESEKKEKMHKKIKLKDILSLKGDKHGDRDKTKKKKEKLSADQSFLLSPKSKLNATDKSPRKTERMSSQASATPSSGGGLACPKCGKESDNKNNYKNHIISHYYQVFYQHLPNSKPFPCPDCHKENRDKITLLRHYAFSHGKVYELTDLTAEDLNPSGSTPVRKRRSNFEVNSSSVKKSSTVKTSVKSDKEKTAKKSFTSSLNYLSKELIDDSDSDESDEEIRNLLNAVKQKIPTKDSSNEVKEDCEKQAKSKDKEKDKDRHSSEKKKKSHKDKKEHKKKDKKKDREKEKDTDKEDRIMSSVNKMGKIISEVESDDEKKEKPDVQSDAHEISASSPTISSSSHFETSVEDAPKRKTKIMHRFSSDSEPDMTESVTSNILDSLDKMDAKEAENDDRCPSPANTSSKGDFNALPSTLKYYNALATREDEENSAWNKTVGNVNGNSSMNTNLADNNRDDAPAAGQNAEVDAKPDAPPQTEAEDDDDFDDLPMPVSAD